MIYIDSQNQFRVVKNIAIIHFQDKIANKWKLTKKPCKQLAKNVLALLLTLAKTTKNKLIGIKTFRIT